MADLSKLQQGVPEHYTLTTFDFKDISVISFVDDEHLLIIDDKPYVVNYKKLILHDGYFALEDFSDELFLSYSANGGADLPHQSRLGDTMAMVAHLYPKQTVVYMPLGISCMRTPQACYALMSTENLVGFGFNPDGQAMVVASKTQVKLYCRDAE